MRTLQPIAGLLLLIASAAAATTATPPAAAPPAAAAPAPGAKASPVDAAVSEALRRTASGDVAHALQVIEPFAKDPALPPAGKAVLGYLYLENKRAAEALAVLEPLANGPSPDAAVLYNAARAAVAAGQPQKGRQWLARATELDPASPAGRAMGMMLARQGNVVDAYRLLRLWLKQNPQDGDARLQAAALALVLERPTEAREYLQGLDANNPAIQLLRAKVLLQLNQPQPALALLQPLVQHHPAAADLEVRRMTASAYVALGRPRDAIALLQGKTGAEPTSVLVLARAQRQAGDAAAALATLAPLAKRLPQPDQVGDPRPATAIAVEYGSLLMAGGHAADAVAPLRQATKLSPWSEPAWRQLAAALQASGNAPESKRAVAEADRLAHQAQQKSRPPAAHAPGRR